MMNTFKQIFLRFLLLTPWLFLVWMIGQGISGEMSMLLVFVLLFILIPGAIVINLVTVVLFQGQQALKMMRQVQKAREQGKKPLESENYAELPWWNPKKYR